MQKTKLKYDQALTSKFKPLVVACCLEFTSIANFYIKFATIIIIS